MGRDLSGGVRGARRPLAQRKHRLKVATDVGSLEICPLSHFFIPLSWSSAPLCAVYPQPLTERENTHWPSLVHVEIAKIGVTLTRAAATHNLTNLTVYSVCQGSQLLLP